MFFVYSVPVIISVQSIEFGTHLVYWLAWFDIHPIRMCCFG